MISDVFHVIYDALLQIIARLEIDISAAAVAGCLTSGLYQPFSSHAVCHRHLMINMINAEKCVFSYQYHFFQHNLRCVYL